MKPARLIGNVSHHRRRNLLCISDRASERKTDNHRKPEYGFHWFGVFTLGVPAARIVAVGTGVTGAATGTGFLSSCPLGHNRMTAVVTPAAMRIPMMMLLFLPGESLLLGIAGI